MKNPVIAIPSSYYVVITTIIVYALLVPIFFEIDNTYGEKGANFIVDDNVKTMTYNSQQVAENPCKSPCPADAEMCITMCAQTDKK